MGYRESHSRVPELHPPVESAPAARRRTGRISLWPAAGWVAFLVYGSLLPFDVHPELLNPETGFGLAKISFRETNPDDAVVNLLLYAPLGLMLAAWGIGRAWRRNGDNSQANGFARPPAGMAQEASAAGICHSAWLVALTVGVCLALSTSIEAVQSASRSRVASWTDVALNTIGGGLGALAATLLAARVRGAHRRVAKAFAARPLNTAATALTLSLFLYHLMPFDFVTTTTQLHSSFSRARLIPMGSLLVGADWAGELQGAGWFMVLGYVLGLAGRRRGMAAASALGSAVCNGVGLAGLIEFMQLFTGSHTFDASSIVILALGVGLGAWWAVFLSDSAAEGDPKGRSVPVVPTSVLVAAAAFQGAMLLFPAVRAGMGSMAGLRFGSLMDGLGGGIPFESLWRAPAAMAAGDIASKLLIYGSLVFTLTIVLDRHGVARSGAMACAGVAALAGAIEVLRSAGGNTTPDWTVVILAIGGGLLSRRAATFLGALTKPHLPSDPL